MPNVFECRLVNNVFKSAPARWAPLQVAIQGFNAGTCNAWDLSFARALVRSDVNAGLGGCGVTAPANVANVFNPATNPTGTLRCDIFQTNANLLGTDANGRARRPIDNVGVQYGLGALNRGQITVADFLDFNAQVGGFDGNGFPQAARHVADLGALRLTYEGGFVNGFNGPGLANIPIITQRTNASGTGDIHDTMQDLIIRARLQRANGRADNQIIFAGSTQSAAAGINIAAISLDVINAWLDNIAADHAPASTDKVVDSMPALATDACWDKTGTRIDEPASTDPAAACNVVYPRFSTLRLEIGQPLVQDVMKCHLKPINLADYAAGAFSAPANLERLNAIFPTGVCDWSLPSVGQVPATAIQWPTFVGGPGFVPLGDPPVSVALGPPLLTALRPAKVWIGVKNSDDVGTFFDLIAEVYKNNDTNPIGSGQLNRTASSSSGFNNAKLNTIPLVLLTPPGLSSPLPVELPSGTVLRLKLWARITCSGQTHASGSVRLWFNDVQTGSRFDSTIDGVNEDFYLRAGSVLGDTQGPGPKSTVDVALNSKSPCPNRTPTLVGTWSITLP